MTSYNDNASYVLPLNDHATSHQSTVQEGLAVASIARDVGSSSTNRSSNIMHFYENH